MAEEVQKTTQEQVHVEVTQEEQVVVVAAEPLAAAAVPVPETEEEPIMRKVVEEDEALVETDDQVVAKGTGGDEEDDNAEKKPGQSASFKEESTRVSDLLDFEKKALEELKKLIREALNKREFSGDTKLKEQAPPAPADEEAKVDAEVTAGEEKKVEGLEEKKTETVENETAQLGGEEEKVDTVAGEAVDDDGAKTVEAIEETIVAVSSSSSPLTQQEQTKKPKEEEAGEDTKPDGPPIAELPQEEVSIWGISLLADERSDVILLKFLRARDFKVKDAFTMIKNTIRWRKEFGIEELLEEELGGDDLGKVVFMHGSDKEGHPVCYNVYGEFQDKELYQKVLSDEDKRGRFLRWRIQFHERSIRKLDFRPGGVSTILQVNDLKDSPGLSKRELRQATNQALQVLQDNYPEFLAKQVFVNVPWWYLAFYKMISPFFTQRTKSKFVFAGPSRSAETLLRYISAEQIPVKYGGLSKDGEFGIADAVAEITVKPASKHTVEFPITEACLLTWEVRVVGWDVRYGAEFTPSAAESYTVIIQKSRKVVATEEPVICNSFKTGEPGKVVLTIDNPSSKRKKLLYRLKTKPSSD